jgi:hypothetical protein
VDASKAVARALESRALAAGRLREAGHDPERCRHVLDGLALGVAHVEATGGREREEWLGYLGTVVRRLHDAPQSGPGRPPRLSRLAISHELRVALTEEREAAS